MTERRAEVRESLDPPKKVVASREPIGCTWERQVQVRLGSIVSDTIEQDLYQVMSIYSRPHEPEPRVRLLQVKSEVPYNCLRERRLSLSVLRWDIWMGIALLREKQRVWPSRVPLPGSLIQSLAGETVGYVHRADWRRNRHGEGTAHLCVMFWEGLTMQDFRYGDFLTLIRTSGWCIVEREIGLFQYSSQAVDNNQASLVE